MLEICICEDNQALRQKISQWVGNFCLLSELDANLALSTENPLLVLEYYRMVSQAVLFFLDIDLGTQMDGMELAQKIREYHKDAFIVFFTTKSEMAPLTFKYQVEALDFIVKDGDEDEIKERILSTIRTAVARHVKTGTGKVFQVKQDDKVIQLPLDEIIYIETTGTRYKLNLYTHQRRLSLNGELKKIEADLDERFIRSHQSFLVNRDHITAYQFPKNEFTLSDGSVIPMSRAGKKILKDLLNQ